MKIFHKKMLFLDPVCPVFHRVWQARFREVLSNSRATNEKFRPRKPLIPANARKGMNVQIKLRLWQIIKNKKVSSGCDSLLLIIPILFAWLEALFLETKERLVANKIVVRFACRGYSTLLETSIL